jgi:hypothetical protein
MARKGRATPEKVKRSAKGLHRTIRRAKRRTWQEILQGAEKDDCWKAMRYTNPWSSAHTPPIKDPEGDVATTLEEKEDMLRRQAFPPPLQGTREEEEDNRTGTACRRTDRERVGKALMGQSTKKAPGPDRLNFKAIRLQWSWDTERVTALVQACIRLGTHPKTWKKAKGVV